MQNYIINILEYEKVLEEASIKRKLDEKESGGGTLKYGMLESQVANFFFTMPHGIFILNMIFVH